MDDLGSPWGQSGHYLGGLSPLDAEIGRFVLPPVAEEAAIEMYAWLEGQFQCFVNAGFDMVPMPSRDLFLDEMTRYGYAMAVIDLVRSAWESIVDAEGNSSTYQWADLLALCPRSTEEWPGG
ncbi:MAG: hypothetical protein FWD83_03795 [Promicromonosporaceae bacterium]|nr:hypothetical protein [Promicromonosporaceae bacterium]